jgi:hypothetical protein
MCLLKGYNSLLYYITNFQILQKVPMTESVTPSFNCPILLYGDRDTGSNPAQLQEVALEALDLCGKTCPTRGDCAAVSLPAYVSCLSTVFIRGVTDLVTGYLSEERPL